VFFGVERGVQRLELAFAGQALTEASDLDQVDDLEVHRPRPVDHHVKVVRAGRDLDAVAALFEQVDRRHAVQGQRLRIHGLLQARVAAREQQHDLELLSAQGAMPGPARQVEEQETLRKGEVLLQQAVAGEPRQRDRQQCMLVVEAHGPHAVGPAPAGRQSRRSAAPARPSRLPQISSCSL
jgi:hypothetical protein